MSRQLARMLEEIEPIFIEETQLPGHIEGIKQLANSVSTPIALGERIFSRWDYKPYFEASCVDIIQPDVAHAGGISECMRLANMAEAYDVGFAPHCPLGPVAFLACLHMDAAVGNFAIQEMFDRPDEKHHMLTYVKNPELFKVVDGYVKVPDVVGLGVEINEDVVRSVDKEVRNNQWYVFPQYSSEDGALAEW